MKRNCKVKIIENGPYLISGGLPLDKKIIGISKEGEAETWIQGEEISTPESYALCRCGNSNKKPFCDGTHVHIGFDGKETASRKTHDEQAQIMEGPTLTLKDAITLCAVARFCHRGGGTWELTHHSDEPKARELAIDEATKCPSGRLVEYDKRNGQMIESKFEKSISLIEDPQKKVSGPIWLKGGILVESSNGNTYEVRNRQTYCRCGKSKNKPFCDGIHIKIGFTDNDESLK